MCSLGLESLRFNYVLEESLEEDEEISQVVTGGSVIEPGGSAVAGMNTLGGELEEILGSFSTEIKSEYNQ